MEKPLVIFGLGDMAELAYFYFSRDSGYKVVAFTIDSAFLTSKIFCGLPVIAFEDISKQYSPDQYDLFIAVGYSKLNALRKEKYLAAKARGYRLATFISSRATVLNDGCIGENCFIFENSVIQPFVTIGNNVTLWSGSYICHHSTIKDHCFIAPNVVVAGGVEVGEQCFIGANATLRDKIKIGEKCIIGAGSLMLADAGPEGLYIGTATERSKLPSTSLRSI